MRIYYVYVIREEFASLYYGLEQKLFRLFLENRQSNGKLKEITKMQIEYISEKVDQNELYDYLLANVQNTKGMNVCNGEKLTINHKRSYAELTMKDQFVQIQAEGLLDAEVTFFELLRQYNPYFLAMDFKSNRCGWLKPIRTLKYANHS
ncbi:sporulation inhibitor of replication protein SirA [Bacillus shivajii]|uniref:sporulation inhibitor of replication protein SirA n=1 Tax=Bacillus shivajii TaxID=1983719 RepID=UPI001CFB0345|nr:sporulation inhibitor of replication protein SirA [Bacillus shivajii]UCZ51627.1 sporulation inhibitor of replication protein SirA [Bacillus shivajii]